MHALIVNDVQTALGRTPSVPVVSPAGELPAYPAQLPLLPYDYGALTQAIDVETMKLHHDRHHATYVENLNNALQQQSNL